MAEFSKRSHKRLSTCHRDLQLVARMAIKVMDFTVLTGHRGKKEQNKLFERGRTKLEYPDSKHNAKPSDAFDVAPYPIDWHDEKRFRTLAGVMFTCAFVLRQQGIIDSYIRWGGDWDMDEHQDDNKFDDLGHFELQDSPL